MKRNSTNNQRDLRRRGRPQQAQVPGVSAQAADRRARAGFGPPRSAAALLGKRVPLIRSHGSSLSSRVGSKLKTTTKKKTVYFRCGALSSDSSSAGFPSLPRAGKACLPHPRHIRYTRTAMPRLPFCLISTISCSCPEFSPFQFLSLSRSNLSTTVLPKASRFPKASLASQTWMTPAISTAFEARPQHVYIYIYIYIHTHIHTYTHNCMH